MKTRILLILICLTVIFYSCNKEENCNCGDFLGEDFDVDTAIGEFAIQVTNHCTGNTETFIIDNIDILNYAELEGIYCSGAW